MNNLLSFVDTFLERVGSFLLALLILCAFAQVVARYLFSSAMAWPEEVCRFLFIAIAYAGAAMTMRSGGHLRVDVLTTLVGPAAQRLLDALTYGSSVVYCLLCAWFSWEMLLEVRDMEQMAASVNLPVYLTWLPIPAGFALMALYAFTRTLTAFTANAEQSGA